MTEVVSHEKKSAQDYGQSVEQVALAPTIRTGEQVQRAIEHNLCRFAEAANVVEVEGPDLQEKCWKGLSNAGVKPWRSQQNGASERSELPDTPSVSGFDSSLGRILAILVSTFLKRLPILPRRRRFKTCKERVGAASGR